MKKLPSYITCTIDYALGILLSRPAIHIRNLKPETCLSIDVADCFRRHVLAGRYLGIFTHIPNEGKRSVINGSITKAMGMIPGVADFVFAWDKMVVFIELKQAGKKPTDNQRFFAMWCSHSKVTYAICYSVAEVEAVIRRLGGI